MSLDNLFKYSNIFKLAITRAKKEDVEENIEYKLKEYVTNSAPYNYIHFSDDDHYKGVNVKTPYDTPMGVYAYPLTSAFYKLIIDQNYFFAADKKYIHIFKATGNILYLDKYNDSDLNNDINKLIKIYNFDQEVYDTLLDSAKRDAKHHNAPGYLFYIVFNMSGGTVGAQSQNPVKAWKIFKQLGYDGIHDNGQGIIHENEPEQAVIFNSKNIKHIDIIKNTIIKPKFTEVIVSEAKQIYNLIIANDFENPGIIGNIKDKIRSIESDIKVINIIINAFANQKNKLYKINLYLQKDKSLILQQVYNNKLIAFSELFSFFIDSIYKEWAATSSLLRYSITLDRKLNKIIPNTRKFNGRYFEANLANTDFSNLNLTDCTFKHCSLENTNFTNTNLKDASFDTCDGLESANFIGANLIGTDFIYCEGLNFANFTGAKRSIHEWPIPGWKTIDDILQKE